MRNQRIDPVTESRLMAACEREFERYVDGLFKRNRMYSMYTTSTIPIIGGDYHIDARTAHKNACL